MPQILGKKIGMTQIYSEDNKKVCVTAIEAGPCPVLAIRAKNIQLGFEPIKEKKLKKPVSGYFKKLNIAPLKVVKEVLAVPGKEYKVGEELKIDMFTVGDFVDVTSTSKGKGFAGGMKRWNWHGSSSSHGQTSHRRVGSIGSSTTPGRVLKGHHLPGHMGHVTVTVQNLLVVKVDVQNNLLLVKGAVPGTKNTYLVVKSAKKKTKKTLIKK